MRFLLNSSAYGSIGNGLFRRDGKIDLLLAVNSITSHNLIVFFSGQKSMEQFAPWIKLKKNIKQKLPDSQFSQKLII